MTLSRLPVLNISLIVTIVSKWFHLFPPGRAGVGLLLLRGVMAFILVANVSTHIKGESRGWIIFGLVILTVAMVLGFLTLLLSCICTALAVGILFLSTDHLQSNFLLATVAVSLALLGPGAYSIDAKLFNRRVVVFRGSPQRHLESERARPEGGE